MTKKFPQLTGLISAFIVCAALSPFATAQDKTSPEQAVLDHLVGKWVMTGTMMDKPAIHDVDAEWVLSHQYVKLHDLSREKNKDGTPAYESNVYFCWDPKAKEYQCVALDNFGGISPMTIGHAKPKENAMPFAFRDGDDTFTNLFTYLPESDTWTWKLDFDQKGKSTVFGRVTLARAK